MILLPLLHLYQIVDLTPYLDNVESLPMQGGNDMYVFLYRLIYDSLEKWVDQTVKYQITIREQW